MKRKEAAYDRHEQHTAAHARAFPGNTAAERADNARKLEDLRVELAPQFDYLAAQGIPRDEVAALWRFTITQRVELAMDKASQRMPLPIQNSSGSR